MRRVNALTSTLVLIALLALVGPVRAQESPLVGAWITTGWDGQEGGSAPGLLIFTETNYSMMFVPAGMTRAAWPDDGPTDADLVAAFNTLVANSGRYTWTGDEFTTEAYVSLSPPYMAAWGENHETFTFRVEGETLHVTWPDDFGVASGSVGTFRKVG